MGLRFVDLWRWDGRVSRKTYALVGFAGFVIKHFVDHFIAAGFFHAYGFFNYWVPLGRGAHLTHLTTDEGKFLATMLLVAMPFLWVGLAMTVRRLRDAGQPVWWVVLFFFPILNLLFFLLLCFLPSRQQAEREEAAPCLGCVRWMEAFRGGNVAVRDSRSLSRPPSGCFLCCWVPP